MLMSVRPYIPEMRNEIFLLLQEMHSETEYKSFELDESKLLLFIDNLYFDKMSLFLVMMEKDQVAGIFAARLMEFFFSNQKMACDQVVYASSRNKSVFPARRVYRLYFEWAKSMGARRILITQTSGIKIRQFEKLNEKLGLKKLGSNYCLDW